MKKLILLGSIFLTMFHIYAYSTENINDLLWRYEVNEGSASLYGYYSPGIYGSYTLGTCVDRQTAGKIIIPTSLGGYPVKGIKSYAFMECSLIEGVIIPDGILNIGDYAFDDCTSIKEVEMPNSVTNIGSSAFMNCTALRDIILSENIKSIGSSVFSGCISLTDITLPCNITSVGYNAFKDCITLTNVTIKGETSQYKILGSGATSYSAFLGCTNLISATVVNADQCMFSGCTRLKYVTFLNGSEFIGEYAFSGCKSLERVVLLDGLSTIGQRAFHSCETLEQVNFPVSITNIGEYAFSGCNSLTNVRLPNSIIKIGNGVFSGCSSVIDVTIPQVICKKKISTYFSSYQSITNVVVADGVTTIGTNCFKNCKSMKTLRIPSTVRYIEEGALYGCEGLEKIIFEGDAPYVGEDVFIGTSRRMEICVAKGSIGWNGTASAELPEFWNGYVISHLSNSGDSGSGSGSGDEGLGGGSSGGESAIVDARYDLADDVADRAIANVEIDGDAAIESFVLKDGKVYDSVFRIVNTSASTAKISLPIGFIYEKFKGMKPLEIPATSTNLLTITRTKGDTFLLSREELVLEVQE